MIKVRDLDTFGEIMKLSNSLPACHGVRKPEIVPGALLGVVHAVVRDLRAPIKNVVMRGAELSVEEADILIELCGAAGQLPNWEYSANAEGFVTYKQLRSKIIHDSHAVVFSRRIAKLVRAELVESRRKTCPESGNGDVTGSRGNPKELRITAKGAESAKLIWDRYSQLEAKVIEGIPADMQEPFYRFCRAVSDNVRSIHSHRPTGWESAAWLDPRRRNSD